MAMKYKSVCKKHGYLVVLCVGIKLHVYMYICVYIYLDVCINSYISIHMYTHKHIT